MNDDKDKKPFWDDDMIEYIILTIAALAYGWPAFIFFGMFFFAD